MSNALSPTNLPPRRLTPPNRERPHGRETFAQRMCRHHRRPVDQFAALAWQVAANWTTRRLRSCILFFAPRYFEAEDLHLSRAADCQWRYEVAEEMHLLRVSFLRRGAWRWFGLGLNGDRSVPYFDHLVAVEAIAQEEQRVTTARPQMRAEVFGKKSRP
jgi:hypothetical protein